MMFFIGDADAFDACMNDRLAVEPFLGHLFLLCVFCECAAVCAALPCVSKTSLGYCLMPFEKSVH